MAPTIHLDPIEAGKQITRGDMHWGETLGAAAGPITFGFRSNGQSEQSSFSKFNADQMEMARNALRLWSNVANITFVEVNPGGYADEATILFGNYSSDDGVAAGFAYMPASGDQDVSSEQGDVWINAYYGDGSFHTFLHEVGHALGLNHPGHYNGAGHTYENDAEYVEDSRQYSEMSYFEASKTGADYRTPYQTDVLPGETISFIAASSVPLLHDIAAIQRLYGANYGFAAEDTTYGFNSNAETECRITDGTQQVVYAVWDGGGNDTLDFSGYSDDQVVDLGEGRFSDVGALGRNVSIALNAVIENAVTGPGHDTLVGNGAANHLTSGNGDDRLIGGAGDDRLDGGLGHDSAVLKGSRSAYEISRVDSSFLLSGPDGRDDLTGIESLVFDDVTVDVLSGVRTVDGKWSMSEGDGGLTTFSFLVTSAGDPSVLRTVSYSISGWGDRPADAADFQGEEFPSGTLTFAPGETSRTISVNVSGDSLIEDDETFGISLNDPHTEQTFESVATVATIANDDWPMAGITALSAEKLEGNSGTTAFTFAVELSHPSVTMQRLRWSISRWVDRDTVDAADFLGSPIEGMALTFLPGETLKIITIDVVDDGIAEPDELFSVVISKLSSGLEVDYRSRPVVADARILDDDSLRIHLDSTSVTRPEGDSGTTIFQLPVFLTRASPVAQSVRWSVSSTSVNGSDFVGGQLPSGMVTFAAGETTKTILVEVNADRTFEWNEEFTLTLSDPSPGLSIGTATTRSTIVNDDSPFSIIRWSSILVEGSSGPKEFTFNIQRFGLTSVSDSISWSVTGSGQNPGDASDFLGGILPSGTVTFASGETSKIITVLVTGDRLGEETEEFAVNLSNPSTGPSSGEKWSATGVIHNDDTSVSVQSTVATKAEGQAGTTAFTFTLTRSGDIGSAHNVAWAVAGTGTTPAAASDFSGGVLPSGKATFTPGQVSTIVTVNVQGDTAVEGDEDFVVTLSNPSAGLSIDTASAGGTIISDDAGVSIAATAAVGAEGQAGSTGFTFTLTRSGSTAIAHSVQWTVAGAGASKATASDFAGGVLPTGTVTFATGETSKIVTVSVAGDNSAEPNEGFTVTLSNPSVGLVIGTASALGTIQNDDGAPPVAAHGDAYVVKQGQVLAPTQPLSTGVLANDDNAATASLLDGPDHGMLQLAGNGTFTYTPAAGFHGIDTFTYRAGNAGPTMDQAQVTIHVVPVSAESQPTLDLVGLTAAEQIAATYAAFFGRGADAGGLDFWVGQFVNNLPTQGPSALFANIASSFAVSDEAKALYPFLVDPFHASDSQINAFLNSVYDNLFNRTPDAGGLGYWTGQVKQTLQANQFVGSVLVNIMSGAQDSAAGQDITTLMGKVAVSLAYVREQREHETPWLPTDNAAARTLLDPVTAEPASVLVGVRNAESLIAGHA